MRKSFQATYQIGYGRESQQIEVRGLDHMPLVGFEYGAQLIPDGSDRYGACIAAGPEPRQREQRHDPR